MEPVPREVLLPSRHKTHRHAKKPQQAMDIAAAQRTNCCWLLLFYCYNAQGWDGLVQIIVDQGKTKKNAAGFVPEASLEGDKLSRWVVAKPYLSATSSSTTSSPASSSSLSLHHACWPVDVPCRRSSVHATEHSPNSPTSIPYSPTRATQATREFLPQRKERGLKNDPPRPPGWLQATRETSSAYTAVVFCCGIPAYPSGVSLCVYVRVYVYVCVCVFMKLHIIAQSGPVILVILCHSH